MLVLVQFCGINAVLYFTPQILSQSGADAMAASVGLTSDSISILASGVTCFMMLPCIFVAMWLMDRAGRRCVVFGNRSLGEVFLSVGVFVDFTGIFHGS